MAESGSDKASKRTKAPVPAPAEPVQLGLKDLAEGILARTVRPKVADVRRLAEAVLKKKAKKGGKKAAGKKRKLSKIPARKSAK